MMGVPGERGADSAVEDTALQQAASGRRCLTGSPQAGAA